MEMTVCFLLLLLCSPSMAQLQSHTDNHITDPGEQTEGETADALIPEQICPQDIHAVLRELSASVAEQRVEMRHLQRENEAQEAKLESQRAEVELQKEKLGAQEAKLESQRAEVELQKQKLEAQEVRLRDLESQKVEVALQKQKLEAQEAKLESQRAEVERQRAEVESQRAEVERQKVEVEELKQNLEAQAAELVTVKSRTNVTEHQVEVLRRDGEVKQVAFSASLSASGEVTLGPYNTETNLVFRHVISNIGNAYSPVTGLFTAPVRGVYHFEFYIVAHGHATVGSATFLLKNGEIVVTANENQTNGFGKSANGVTLLLEVGDVVFLHLPVNNRIFDNEYHHSTFSGHLLFTM